MSDVAVIVATYNRPDALRAVLDSLAAQSFRHFSVTIADDGSTESTRREIEAFEASVQLVVRHVWQPDDGPGKCSALNRAVAATPAEYLIFIDGDCVLRHDFVATHVRLAERGSFVRGSRIRIGESLTHEVLSTGATSHEWPRTRWFLERLRGRIDRWSPLLRLPLGSTRHAGRLEWKGVKGCNVAIWRDDLLAVNGFDESIAGPGPEDVDLAVRLIRHGVFRKEARYAAPVLHLWHPERPLNAENERVFESRLHGEGCRAAAGIDQYV